MTNAAITNLLKQMHDELAGTPSLTTEDRELLRQLAADIQALLAEPAGSTPPSLGTRVADAVTRLEASHPDLTGVLVQVGKALGDMGI